MGSAVVLILIGIIWFSSDQGRHDRAKPVDTLKKEIASKVHILGVHDDSVDLELGKDQISLQFIKPEIFRVHIKPNGQASPHTLVIGKTDWVNSGTKVQINTNNNPIVIQSDKIKVTLDKVTLKLSIYNNQNHLLLQQPDISAAVQDNLTMQYSKGDSLYGIHGYDASEDSSAGLLRNSTEIAKAGMQGYAGAPFIWSTSGYGMLVDSTVGRFDITDNQFTMSARSKADADYYIFAGLPKDIFRSLSEVSGKPPMFPKWAMGFTNSQWGIDENELLQIVKTYRQKHIPLDNFTLDFDWKAWGEDQYGEFRWNGKKFADGPTGKLKELMDQQGVKLTGIMKPRLHMDTVEGKHATEHGYWYPNEKPSEDYFSKKAVKDLNFNLADVRNWFFNDILKHSFDTGIVGWWNDEADELGDSTQFMNMERALYDGQRSYTNTRVWSINRNFYLGSQRYAYGLWSGDIPTGFQSMAAQRERMLSAINAGEMKWGMDSGGFSGHPSDENYARWIEFSAFTPIFRTHGTLGEKRQPWVYGPTAEKAAANAIRLRYQFIPYIYAYEHQDYQTGTGLVHPLIFDYPSDPNVKNDVQAWMFGDSLLVSPVVDQGQTTKDIYLPQGTWIDYFKGTVYSGNQTIHYAVNSKAWDDIPLFIKKGAIIPTEPVMDYVGQKTVDTMTVDVFPDEKQTTLQYYDDDGKTYNYEKGQYFIQRLAVQKQGEKIDFSVSLPEGSFKPQLKYYLLKFHGKPASSVSSSGSSLQAVPNLDRLQAGNEEGWTTGKDQYGDVTCVKISAGMEKNIAVE